MKEHNHRDYSKTEYEELALFRGWDKEDDIEAKLFCVWTSYKVGNLKTATELIINCDGYREQETGWSGWYDWLTKLPPKLSQYMFELEYKREVARG